MNRYLQLNYIYVLQRKAGYYYSCSIVPLFELGSLHHDYYLLDLRLPVDDNNNMNNGLGQIVDIWLVVSRHCYYVDVFVINQTLSAGHKSEWRLYQGVVVVEDYFLPNHRSYYDMVLEPSSPTQQTACFARADASLPGLLLVCPEL
jgi:hypothetical protein